MQGSPQTKPIVGNKIPAFWGSSPCWKPREWKRIHPPAGRASHWSPSIRSRGPTSPWTSGEPRLIPGIPGADAARLSLHAPRTLSYQMLPELVGVPLAGCAGAARAEPDPVSTINTALERPPDLAPKRAPLEWPDMRVMGRADEGEPDL